MILFNELKPLKETIKEVRRVIKKEQKNRPNLFVKASK
jgi:hypothetical protein